MKKHCSQQTVQHAVILVLVHDAGQMGCMPAVIASIVMSSVRNPSLKPTRDLLLFFFFFQGSRKAAGLVERGLWASNTKLLVKPSLQHVAFNILNEQMVIHKFFNVLLIILFYILFYFFVVQFTTLLLKTCLQFFINFI